MKPLIDGDILLQLHEIGWSAEFKDKETSEVLLFDADYACDLLKEKIEGICFDVDATEPPLIFLSDSEWLSKKLGRPFIKGFRYEAAKTRPYKGNRINPKPFHFYNLIAEMLFNYEVKISSDGLEADDELCRYQYESASPTIICSRDKDVRICPGWHFSWECGTQHAIGPVETDIAGKLVKGEKGKIMGWGTAFFYYQMLVGDTADYIPGLTGFGTVKAFNLLHDKTTTKEQYETVKTAYKEILQEKAKEYFLEQASLLWMKYNKEDEYVFKHR